MHLAVVGKGGSGKSVIAGTMARVLARRGHRVLALDSDTLPGLALSLGADVPGDAPLNDAATKEDDSNRWHLKKGVGPVRAVQRYATVAPDGVRLLQLGKLTADGHMAIRPSTMAFFEIVHRLPERGSFDDWVIVGDLPAGPRQTAYNWAPYAKSLVLVVEPTWQSALTARRIARIARTREGVTVRPIANKVAVADDEPRIEERIGEPVFRSIPLDPAVRESDRLGVALIDHDPASATVQAVEGLVDALLEDKLPGVMRG